MGTITCVVNADSSLTFTSILGTNGPSDTWAKLKSPSFQFSGGGTFTLVFAVPSSDFQFNPSTPVVWQTGSQPTWIQFPSTPTATLLTLSVDSSQPAGNSTFTIQNFTVGGQSIEVNVQTTGDTGGDGGTFAVYLGDDATALIGPMPAGAVATGSDVRFGFLAQDEQEIAISPGAGVEEITGLTWIPSMPGFVQTPAQSGSVFTIPLVNSGTARLFARFSINVNTASGSSSIDPTIITNPDESGPTAAETQQAQAA